MNAAHNYAPHNNTVSADAEQAQQPLLKLLQGLDLLITLTALGTDRGPRRAADARARTAHVEDAAQACRSMSITLNVRIRLNSTGTSWPNKR